MKLLAFLLVSAYCASCAAGPNHRPAYELGSASSLLPREFPVEAQPLPRGEVLAQDSFGALPPAQSTRPEWRIGQPLLQGFLGVTEYSTVSREGGGSPDVDGDEGNLETIPLIGGGAQYKLGGERLDFGFEGFFSFGGRANASAYASTGGGTVVAVDVDLLIFDLYGGPFVSTFLGDKLRLYAGVGPLLEWADYDESDNGVSEGGSGFGYGTYARTGVEFVLPSRTMIGFGVRWSDSTVDLGGDLGDLDMEGFQVLFTVSRGI